MKRTIYITAAFIFFTIISVAFTTYQQPKYKNLKILPKNISKEALDSIMHYYSFSLGVKCGFCHQHSDDMKQWDMASDVKPEKRIARKMMLMTGAINKMYFKPEPGEHQNLPTVTCYTCHHGTEHPEPVMAPAEPPRPPRPIDDNKDQRDSAH